MAYILPPSLHLILLFQSNRLLYSKSISSLIRVEVWYESPKEEILPLFYDHSVDRQCFRDVFDWYHVPSHHLQPHYHVALDTVQADAHTAQDLIKHKLEAKMDE